MTQIKTIMAQRAEELDAAVNAALRKDERWARTREIRTHYDGGKPRHDFVYISAG